MNRKSIPIFIVTSIILIILIHCGKNSQSPIGKAFIEPRGAEKDTIFYTSLLDTFYHADVAAGISSYLYLGETDHTKAKTLIWFSNFPDSGTVDSAFVTLTPYEIIGALSGTFSAFVYLVENNWDEYEITWELFDHDLTGNEITTFDLDASEINTNLDSMTIQFDIPVEHIQSWMNTTTADNNYGILITYQLSNFIVGFYGRGLSNGPKLDLHVTQDTTQHEEIVPLKDAFIATSLQTENPDRLYIQNGSALRTFLDFDVTLIPEDATVNRALLFLHSDTLLSIPDNSESFYILAYPVKNMTTWPITTIVYDTANYVSGTAIGDSATFNITSIVQDWTSGVKENFGLMLKGNNEYFNLHQRAFFSTTVDSVLQPCLKIYYTEPPSSRL
jgi:hypothetical protein